MCATDTQLNLIKLKFVDPWSIRIPRAPSRPQKFEWSAGWEAQIFWHSPTLGSLLYGVYKIPLAQASFPLARPNCHSHWRALVSQPDLRDLDFWPIDTRPDTACGDRWRDAVKHQNTPPSPYKTTTQRIQSWFVLLPLVMLITLMIVIARSSWFTAIFPAKITQNALILEIGSTLRECLNKSTSNTQNFLNHMCRQNY